MWLIELWEGDGEQNRSIRWSVCHKKEHLSGYTEQAKRAVSGHMKPRS